MSLDFTPFTDKEWSVTNLTDGGDNETYEGSDTYYRGVYVETPAEMIPDPGLKGIVPDAASKCKIYHLVVQVGNETRMKELNDKPKSREEVLKYAAKNLIPRVNGHSDKYKVNYIGQEMLRAHTQGPAEVGNIGYTQLGRGKTWHSPETWREDFVDPANQLDEQSGANVGTNIATFFFSFRVYEIIPVSKAKLERIAKAATKNPPTDLPAQGNITFLDDPLGSARRDWRNATLKSIKGHLKRLVPTGISTFPNLNKAEDESYVHVEPAGITANFPAYYLSMTKDDLAALENKQNREEFDKTGKKPSETRAEKLAAHAKAAERKRKLDEFKKDKESEAALVLNNALELAKRRRKLRKEKGQIHKNFACFDFKDSDLEVRLDDIGSVVSAPKNMAAFFEDLRPIHYSALIPRVRIYKDQVDSPNKSKNLLEYEFEEYFDITSAGNSAGILKNLYATSNGVNVTSFDWSYTGKDPYQASTIIMVDIKFRAQNIDVLYEPRTFIDKDGKSTKYKFADLMIPGFLNTQDDGVRDEKTSTALRTVVEYSVNESDGIWEGYEDLKNVIKSMRTEMSLYLMNYEIDLQDTGTVVIGARYTGRLNSDFEDPKKSVLGQLPTAKDNAGKYLKERKLARKQVDIDKKKVGRLAREIEATKQTDAYAANATSKTIEQQGKEIEKKRTEKINLEAGIAESDRRFRFDLKGTDAYELFASELSTKIIYRDFASEILKKLHASPVSIVTKKLAGELGSHAEEYFESRQQHRNKSFSETIVNLPENEDTRQKAQENFNAIKSALLPTYDNENYYIKYVYFGDIVEHAIASFLKNKLQDPFDANDVRIALGPVDFLENINYHGAAPLVIKQEYVDESAALREKVREIAATTDLEPHEIAERFLDVTPEEIEEMLVPEEMQGDSVTERSLANLRGDTNAAPLKHRINIADIPISVNLLLDHFNDKIVQGGKQNYTLSNFLRDSFLELIQKQFTVDSEHVLMKKQQITASGRSSFITTIENKNDKKDALGFKFVTRDDIKGKKGETGKFALWSPDLKTGPNADNLVYLTELKENGKLPIVTHKSNYHEANSTTSYLFIYGKDSGEVTRANKTKKQDLEDGIYHLKVGAEAGAVKDISLKTVSSATYEAMTLQIADKKGQPISRRVYDATVTLHGTPFVIPGQVVYINPAAFGTEEHLKDLGLVGYFLVISVSNSISEGRYETVLECKFTGN